MAATSLSSFKLTGIRPHASSGHRKPDQNRRRTTSSNWWTPLFGWSSDPDYIGGGNNNATDASADKPPEVSDTAPSASRFALGCFTEEKAKQLRKKTTETANFHDIMYHSAIASRLASDVTDRYGD